MADSESKNIKGTNVASGIVPFTTDDKYPTHYAQYGKGGYRTVDNITERDEIPSERLEEGMLVYVINDSDNIHTYQYIKDKTTGKLSWQRASFSAQGIPVYDQKTLDDLGKDAADNYIFIPSESELEGEVPANQTEIVTHGGSYLNILFSAIRQLQVEVAKMRNAFRYGLNSYTGTQTAMSTQVNEIEDPDEEPLWAIEPDMLSIIAGAEVIIDGTTAPSNLTPGNNITLEETKLIINSTGCTWSDVENIVKNTEDTKLFLYLTFSKGDSTTFELNVKLEDINVEEEPTQQSEGEEGDTPVIDLKTLLNKYGDKITNLTKYNILIVVSRQHTELGGSNYVWVSIGSPEDGKVAGYYNFNNKSLYDSKINLNYSKYTFKEIGLKSLDLYQLDFYSKYQDFSNEVSENDTTIPEAPSDNDYKYKVAHITIRSIENKETMESIQHQLLENELIFNEEDKTLWIKMKNKGLVSIAGSGGGTGGGGNNDTDNDNMTIEQIIRELMRLGIIYQDGNPGNWNGDYSELTPGTGNLKISSISDITFIHQATGKKFNFEVTSDGDLKSTEIPLEGLEDKIASLMGNIYGNDKSAIRGFVSKLRCGNREGYINLTSEYNTTDVGQKSDRIRIGSFYMPHSTDNVFGCSHAYIELENSSDMDFPLDGCCLFFYHPKTDIEDERRIQVLDKLDLKGILPAGSTFLIRGKKYSDPSLNPSTYINVDDFDMEWFSNGELIDFTIDKNYESEPYGFALIYDGDLGNNTKVSSLFEVKTSIDDNDNVEFTVPRLYLDPPPVVNISDNAPYTYPWYYIDSVPINGDIRYLGGSGTGPGAWGNNKVDTRSNTIIKNTFELDPAKQALQSLNKYDSSRNRLANVDEDKKTCDYMFLNLNLPTISFPHSDEEYLISKYTPRSSKFKKNVITDKTSFDLEKPNCVCCSFGIDTYKTRCFNWVSAGEFDEYVWIKEDSNTWNKYESYKIGDHVLPQDNKNFPRKRIFNETITNTIYSRISNIFPGCGIHYTSHKCIIDIVEENVTEKTTYTYVVGRADKTGNAPDMNHSSEEYTFTLYPDTNYTPKLYLTTDQQGFHWVEYQVWSAAAKKLNSIIESESNNIIPVLLNSGDMTQNGTRVNEWLDYFNGAKPLLKHLEHMAVVGNNDLCPPDPKTLGTGNDPGKSNPYFFHIFNCNEIQEKILVNVGEEVEEKSILPIINNIYIPSIYYFDFSDLRILMCNSEITATTCKNVYNLTSDGGNRTYNVYTGWEVKISDKASSEPEKHISTVDSDLFTPIYTILWRILNNNNNSKKCIAVCHEMPFTVITNNCVKEDQKGTSRSLNENNALVGSHLNQIHPNDVKSLYWFSRLCEYFKIKLVLGGHKHTYSCTYPIRENYLYKIGEDICSSLNNGPMTMEETLVNDTVSFIGNSLKYIGFNEKEEDLTEEDYYKNVNLSKFPIIKKTDELDEDTRFHSAPESGSFYPVYPSDKDDDYTFVTYFMAQATGYKQTSNKELPSQRQLFSKLIPKTTIKSGKDSADSSQKHPMYVTVEIDNDQYNIKLFRLENIQMEGKDLFTQNRYSNTDITSKVADLAYSDGKRTSFCNWDTDNSKTTITI